MRGKGKEVYYYFHNHQGSVIAVVDGEGNIVNKYDYWADGNIRYVEEGVEQPFLYTGAYYDRERGLYYLRARYYSPELRRFLQRDPILFEGGINLYAYTGCDFVNWGDWEGLSLSKFILIGIITYKVYRLIRYTYFCFLCLSKLKSPEMEECIRKHSNPDYCLDTGIQSPSAEILEKCYPRECDEGCLTLFKVIYIASWKGGRL